MVKAIIFDFGGVFSIDDDIEEFWKNNAEKFNIDKDEANKISLPIWMEARIGKIDSNIFWTELGKLIKMPADEFKKYFVEYTGFRNELYNFVKDNLKGKYKLGILSSQIESWLEPILEEKKFRDIFDVIVTSYNSGFAKPDIRIYKEILEKLEVEGKDCIYIEDREKNLEPAKELDMRIIKFKNFVQFKDDLEKIL